MACDALNIHRFLFRYRVNKGHGAIPNGVKLNGIGNEHFDSEGELDGEMSPFVIESVVVVGKWFCAKGEPPMTGSNLDACVTKNPYCLTQC